MCHVTPLFIYIYIYFKKKNIYIYKGNLGNPGTPVTLSYIVGYIQSAVTGPYWNGKEK